jgi:hypothetical protein
VKYAKKHNLPIKFILFGYSTEQLVSSFYPNLVVTGKYDRADLPDLIDKYDCDRALFLSPWPETFSYTLSEAFELGLYPIAIRMGAFIERIQNTGFGELFFPSLDTHEICELLMKTIPLEKEYSFGKFYDDFLSDYYDF